MRYHVLKLIPPRPTFVQDMTRAEAQLMHAHGLHWQDLMKQGSVVIFGPVLDPSGPYGLAVVRLEDDADPSHLWRDDPVIKADRGFSFQAAPMLSALLPGES